MVKRLWRALKAPGLPDMGTGAPAVKNAPRSDRPMVNSATTGPAEAGLSVRVCGLGARRPTESCVPRRYPVSRPAENNAAVSGALGSVLIQATAMRLALSGRRTPNVLVLGQPLPDGPGQSGCYLRARWPRSDRSQIAYGCAEWGPSRVARPVCIRMRNAGWWASAVSEAHK